MADYVTPHPKEPRSQNCLVGPERLKEQTRDAGLCGQQDKDFKWASSIGSLDDFTLVMFPEGSGLGNARIHDSGAFDAIPSIGYIQEDSYLDLNKVLSKGVVCYV